MVDVTLETLASRVEAQTPAGSALDRVAAATLLAGELRELGEGLLDRYVQAARAEERSWSEIGAALGVTKQAAQQRFAGTSGEVWPKEFSASARAVLPRARGEARRLRHRYLDTEHVLLALTAEDGLAGATLAGLGIDADRVRDRIRETVGDGHSGTDATLGISPRLKQCFEAARAEALRLGHRCSITEPEHLLLALSAQRDGVAARILRELGAGDAQVRGQLAELLAGEAPELAAKLRRPPSRRLRRR